MKIITLVLVDSFQNLPRFGTVKLWWASGNRQTHGKENPCIIHNVYLLLCLAESASFLELILVLKLAVDLSDSLWTVRWLAMLVFADRFVIGSSISTNAPLLSPLQAISLLTNSRIGLSTRKAESQSSTICGPQSIWEEKRSMKLFHWKEKVFILSIHKLSPTISESTWFSRPCVRSVRSWIDSLVALLPKKNEIYLLFSGYSSRDEVHSVGRWQSLTSKL